MVLKVSDSAEPGRLYPQANVRAWTVARPTRRRRPGLLGLARRVKVPAARNL